MTMESNGNISVVVPVYRGEGALEELCHGLVARLEPLGRSFEIILVEDCGGDGSWEIIRRLAASEPRIRGFRLSRNFGQHNALLCGIRQARYEIIVTMDDDLQHPPEAVPMLIAKLEEGYDVVYGTPEHERHGFWRNLASVATKYVIRRIMNVPEASEVSAFRVFKARLAMAFEGFSNPFVSIDVLLSWATTSFASLRVPHRERKAGESGYTFGRLVSHAMNMIIGYSPFPLRVASLMGFLFTLFGFGILAYVVSRYFMYGSPVPGFPFLASIIAIFGGVQLFVLGVIGEYLGNVYLGTMGRPPYVVADSTGQDDI